MESGPKDPDGRLQINSAARFHCAPDWSWDTAGVDFTDRDLWVVLSGSGELLRAEERFRLTRGDAFILDGSHRIRASHRKDAPLTVVAVHFSGGGPLPLHVRMAPIGFLAGVLDRLLRCRLRADHDTAHRWLQAALDEICSEALSAPQTRRDLIGSLADRIREQPGDDWRIGPLAEAAGMTPQHLGRLFREYTGRSPKEYLLDARLEAARAYLRGSSLTIKRIASELGFHDEFHFSRMFHSRVGVSPTMYRGDRLR